MKKIISILLTMALVLGLSITALAEGSAPTVKPDDITLKKTYTMEGGTAAPREELSFTVTPDDANLTGGSTGDLVVGTNNKVTTSGSADTTFTMTFPTYSKIGVYKYTVSEVAGTTQGVTYDTTPIVVVVTITNKVGEDNEAILDELQASVAIHKGSEKGDKINDGTDKAAFTNVYGQGSLTVTKIATGNLASKTKEFSIKVTFTIPPAEEGGAQTSAASSISYTVAGSTTSQTLSFNEAGVAETTVALSSTKSAVFTNIPSGVRYTVVEDSRHAEGADDPAHTEEGYTISYDGKESGTIGTTPISTTVTNTKKTEIDTGIVLDSLPFVMIITIAVAAVVLMAIRKRREMEG